MNKKTLVLALFGCAATQTPMAMASDFQSAMPATLRSNISQPSVNTPNKSTQPMMQTPTGADSTPMSPSSPLPLRGVSGNQSPVNPSPGGAQEPYNAPPVSTFFKVSGAANSQQSTGASSINTLPSKATLNSVVQKNGSATPGAEANPVSAKDFVPHKFIWHLLDNMGVPMFIGKDNDLAPELRRPDGMPDKSYFLSAQSNISDKGAGAKPKIFQLKPKHPQPSSNNSSAAPAPNSDIGSDAKAHDDKPRSPLEKIPQSELEGVSPMDSSDNDAQKTKP